MISIDNVIQFTFVYTHCKWCDTIKVNIAIDVLIKILAFNTILIHLQIKLFPTVNKIKHFY